jgi:hypothetical protein
MAYSKQIGPASETTSNTGADVVYSGGVTMPTGRAMANGSKNVLLTALRGYLRGYGSSRQVRMRIASRYTDYFTVSSGSSATSTGARDLTSPLLAAAGSSQTFYAYSDGRFYFGRGGSGHVTDGGPGWDGFLAGDLYYVQAPTAPRSPSIVPGSGGEATVSWLIPSDDGDSAITGYRVFYSLNSNMSDAQYVDVGASELSAVLTGLTLGRRWYTRVAARNAVTNAAGTTSVFSSTVSADINGGGEAYDDGWKPQITEHWDGSAWVPQLVEAWDGTAWVPQL